MRTSLLLAALVLSPAFAAAPPDSFGNAQVRLQLAPSPSAWWSYRMAPSGRAFAFAPPSFEIDGATVSDGLIAVHAARAPRTLPHGVTEYAWTGVFAHHPALHATLVFRIAESSPVVRFRYEIYSTSPAHLTRKTGADRLDYFTLSLADLKEVREVRFSEFQEATHSFTLSERTVRPEDLDNALRFMGPLFAASDGRDSLLVAYEHGSQVPDAFLEFRAGVHRVLSLSAVKGNYLNGQPLTADRPWRSVWFHAAAHAGSIDALAPLYRDFILRDLDLAGGSRTPYIFYNTWNFQERNKHWYKQPYLASMNEQRMLAEIDVAHAMGIDVFVLDTGWYEKTGDWAVSTKRFPNGLAPIQARLQSYGMQLGLWFNPTAAAVSSAMLAHERANVMSRNGKQGKPGEVWETEASHSMCLVSPYADAFADKLIEVAKATGARYFKWDAIGQYGCDSPNHLHGGEANTPVERADSYAFQLPAYMARIVERLNAAVPGAIVDFDITEGGRAVGLGFLSAGKYFLINNGPYKFNYDLPMDFEKDNWNLFFYPGPARTWICRTPLTFDKWIPSVLFLTHYLPDDPIESQAVNLASLVLGQNGIWGDLPKVSPAGVGFIGDALRHYKQVRDDVTAASPLRSGGVGGTPEIHEKLAANGRGAVAVFATVPGDFTYVTSARPALSEWHFGDVKIARDATGHARIRVHFEKPGAAVVFFGATAAGPRE